MTDLFIRPVSDSPRRNIYAADSPIDFAAWLTIAENLNTELIHGVMVDRMAAHYPHEAIFAWLFALLRSYTRHFGLGVVLGSRTAVKIDEFDGRLPDLLFVRAENIGIIRNDAIYGIPDLVIEIVSPNDRPSDLIPLETDYRILGVPKIVFINPQKQHVRVVTKGETGYDDRILAEGRLEFASIPGFWIEVGWLFADTQPDELATVLQLVREEEARKT
jgi:Uma2 family endonuclease